MSHFIYYAQCHYAECRYGECRGAVVKGVQSVQPEAEEEGEGQCERQQRQDVTDLGPMLSNFLHSYFTNVCNKVECLFLAGISSLV